MTSRISQHRRFSRLPRGALVATWAAAVSGGACGASQSSVLPDDTGYLAVGVEPARAIDEATRVLEAHGASVSLRVDAPRYSAVALGDRSGTSAIRVASRRGTALALDASAEDGALLSLDPRTGTDLTGDGAADLVVVRTETARVCVALAEIDEEGVLRAVPTELRWIDPRLCIAELVDLDHDARVEALVLVPFVDLTTDRGAAAPSITVPMALDDRSAFVPSAWPEGFAVAETTRRDAQLEDALSRGDAASAARLAIELSMIAAVRGADDDAIDAPLVRAEGIADDDTRWALDQAAGRARSLRTLAAPAPEVEPSEATDESASVSTTGSVAEQ